jgi:hypothetical protein
MLIENYMDEWKKNFYQHLFNFFWFSLKFYFLDYEGKFELKKKKKNLNTFFYK